MGVYELMKLFTRLIMYSQNVGLMLDHVDGTLSLMFLRSDEYVCSNRTPLTSPLQAEVVEALRRSKFKFSGRQKIYVSKKFGFTKWDREEYAAMRADGRLKLDGVNCKHFYLLITV